jgi:hypothetical protein
MTRNEISYFTADELIYGETYGHWTVRWWWWFFSTPKSVSPITDPTGKLAHANQPFNDVLFLAGKFADKEKSLPNRSCRVDSGKAILFPVINCEANSLEYPDLHTDDALIEHVRNDENSIVRRQCSVDGSNFPVQRIVSDPRIFELNIKRDNVANAPEGVTRASADGYWVFLRPPPIGRYRVSFSGSCEFGRLNSGANYKLEVLERESLASKASPLSK